MHKAQEPSLLSAMKNAVDAVSSRRVGRDLLRRRGRPDREDWEEQHSDVEEAKQGFLHTPTIRRRRNLSTRSKLSEDEKDDQTINNSVHSNKVRNTLKRKQRRRNNRDEGKDSDEGEGRNYREDMTPSFERKMVERAEPKVFSNNNTLSGYPSCIRKPLNEKVKRRQHSLLRTPAEGIPEVHFIGEVCSGSKMGHHSGGGVRRYISCAWSVEWGKSWSFLEGEFEGQTQYSLAQSRKHDTAWNHPIDIHLASASMQGWPRIILQLWDLDDYGRTNLIGYGFSHLPTSTGHHELVVTCWRPCRSIGDQIRAFFLGATTQLTDESVIFGKAWDSRHRLVTVASGQVRN